MQKKNALNTFTNGLAMDNNPLTVPNSVMTSALNATIVTRNGDENMLQPDMGNGRVETAYLPEGFIPVGTVEFNGIIYVASYNPLTNRSQIGSFPSPERNVTTDKITDCENIIENKSFIDDQHKYPNVYNPFNNTYGARVLSMPSIKASSIKLKLLTDNKSGRYLLNPGDRYKVYQSAYDGNVNALITNAGSISDIYQADATIVDDTPRYLTIHMISISEDSKINYLDQNLKWDWNGGKYGYYINGDIKEDHETVDIDQYRSLVSSAYNVFNSKVSGELALLFDLKIVDTFTVTWDASVSDYVGEEGNDPHEGCDKMADIWFNVNYTSGSSRINLKYVWVTGSWLAEQKVDQDQINNGVKYAAYAELNTFDPYVDSEDETDSDEEPSPKETLDRKNDGTDKDITIFKDTGHLFYYSSDSLSDTVWSYQLTPAMPFGCIDWLAVSGSINFNLLGSGVINLIEWRYYVSNTALTLSWGLEAYPEINKKIYSVSLEFYTPENIPSEGNDATPNHIITINKKSSYSGYFQNIVYFENVTTLDRDKLYLVKISILYGDDTNSEERPFYRWLYTTGQWNSQYLSQETMDFRTLKLSDSSIFNVKFDVNDNIQQQTTENIINASVPVLYNDGDQTYDMLGAKVTAVNYDWSKHAFTDDYGVSMSVSTSIVGNYSLFTTDTKKMDVALESGSISADAQIKHYAPTKLDDNVILPKVMDPAYPDENNPNKISGIQEETISLLKTIEDDGIPSEDANNAAIDSFDAELIHDTGNMSFQIKMRGVIFSKIDAEYYPTACMPSSILRPMLLYQSDLSALNLIVQDNTAEGADLVVLMDKTGFNYRCVDTDLSTLEFKEFYRIWTRQPTGNTFIYDIGAGHDTSWEFLPYDGATYSGYWGDPQRQASKASDDHDYVNYWHEINVKSKQGAFYSDYIVSALNKSSNALFQAIYYAGAWDTSQKHYQQISYIDNNEKWAEKLTFPLPVPATVLSYAYGHDGARNLMKGTCGFWVRTDSDEDPFMPIDFYVPMRMNEEGLCDPTPGYASYGANRPHILAAVAGSIYNCLYTVTNDQTELICNRVTSINWLDPYTETWDINLKVSAAINDENICVDGVSLLELGHKYQDYTHVGLEFVEDGTPQENAGLDNVTYSSGEGYTDLGNTTISHNFTLTETDIYGIYEKYLQTHGVGAYANDCDGSFMVDDIDNADSTSVYIRLGLSSTRKGNSMSVLNTDTVDNIYLTQAMTMTSTGRIYATEQGCNMVKHTSRDLSMAKDAFAAMKVDTNGRTTMFSSEELLKNTGWMCFCTHASEPGDGGDFDDETQVIRHNPIMHLGYNNHEGSTDL